MQSALQVHNGTYIGLGYYTPSEPCWKREDRGKVSRNAVRRSEVLFARSPLRIRPDVGEFHGTGERRLEGFKLRAKVLPVCDTGALEAGGVAFLAQSGFRRLHCRVDIAIGMGERNEPGFEPRRRWVNTSLQHAVEPAGESLGVRG